MVLLSFPPQTVTLGLMLAALRERVAAWGGRRLMPVALVLLLYRRVGEIGVRMERLLARFRAGRLVVRRPGVTRQRREEMPCPRGKRVWPGRFGWLVQAGSHEAAGLAAQLRFVLDQPDMVALLQAAPQAVRLLQPLCRALAIETDVLHPGRVPVPPVEKPARVPRVRKPRLKLDLGRIPLPRGVLSAARREGYGKIR